MSKKQVIVIAAASFFFFIIGIAVYLNSVYKEVSETADAMYQPDIRNTSELRTTELELVRKEPFSVLLLGVDERDGDIGRSDTIIVLTVNPSIDSIKMLSIPRDTYTEIIGLNKMDKINHAYSFGGIDTSLYTVENLLDIPLDYVVQVNMESFVEIINIVGGISVENPFPFEIADYTFTEGKVNLDGEAALRYVQMRMDDPEGDFGRQNRQKQVLQAVLKKGASLQLFTKYKEFLGIFEKHIKTNMTFEQLIDIQKGYTSTLNQIEPLAFENGEGMFLNGIWYYQTNKDELEELKFQLKKHLEIKETTP